MHADYQEKYSHFILVHVRIKRPFTQESYVKGEISSFVSSSNSQDHGPAVTWAYLNRFLELLKAFARVKITHFFSDGPSNQHHQKKNFYSFSTIIFYLKFTCGTWSYFEASHGKAAADSAGEALKRKTKDYVAYGGNIPDAEIFYSIFKENFEIKLYFVSHDQINCMAKLIQEKIKPTVGMQKIHQVVTNVREGLGLYLLFPRK